MTKLEQMLATVREFIENEDRGWCTVEKAQTMAMMVCTLRPRLVVEIGVWQGGSVIPMLLALKHVGTGKAIAIDPWEAAASIEGQNEANTEWWGQVPHEAALDEFRVRLARHGLDDICGIIRQRSNDVDPQTIGVADIVHVDGNHGEQAIYDVQRFTRCIPVGGVLVLDDISWEGGAVKRAHARAVELGFQERYHVDAGCAMVRIRPSPANA